MKSGRIRFMSAVFFPLILTACTTMEGQGCAAGALLGAGIGVLAGGNDLRNAGIGAGVGCLAGSQYGRYVESRRARYASDEAFFDAEIRAASDYNERLSTYTEAVEQEIRRLESEIAELTSQNKAESASRAELRTKKERITELQKSVTSQLAEVETELKNKRQVLAYMQANGAAGRASQLQTEIALLEGLKEKLNGATAQLADTKSRFPSSF